MTFVDRRTRCSLSWRVVYERTGELVQEMRHESVQGDTDFSDALEAYQTALYWPADHFPMDFPLDAKRETYSVEGDNAELRHYLARLVRRSRCFTRCIHALRRAVKLFVYAFNVYAFNHRQLARHRFPAYPHQLIDFVYP